MTYLRPLGDDVAGNLLAGNPAALFDGSYWKRLQQEAAEQPCRDAAAKASADLEAKTLDLARNWKPTGFYTVKDFEAMLRQTWSILTKAGQDLDRILADDFAEKSAAASLRRSISNRFGESQVFVTAMNEAKNKNITVLDAPGFKNWVIKAMNEAALGYEHVAYMACIRPWFIDLLAASYPAFDAAVKVGKAMVAAVVGVGQAVLKVPDFLATMWNVLIWGGGAIGLLWLAQQFRRG